MTYRILTVCTGNICRSPMAEYQLREAIEARGLSDRVEVASVGTTSWEQGEPIDGRAGALLRERGIDASSHRARHMSAEEVQAADLVLALDTDHLDPLHRVAGNAKDRVRMLREFDPEVGDDPGIRDPWYGADEDFETVHAQIAAALDGILDHVEAELAGTGTSR
ncbi:MAG: low molecular weight protein-tyrosine-phosphatase [Brachybacterium sp.]|nr:low molecular weight protein-tyrosine-phosphatase [Brachybacterium sp.]